MVSQQARIRRKTALLALWVGITLLLCSMVALIAPTPSSEAVALDCVAREIVANTTMGRQGIVGSIWWAPLPTILRVPLVAWWPAEMPAGRLSQWTECGVLAVAFLLLAGALARYRGRAIGSVIAALALLNPWLFRHVLAGSSLALSLCATLTLFYATALWADKQGTRALIIAGLAGALLLGSSALGLPALLLVALVLVTTAGPSAETHRKEAVFLLGMVPPLYVLSLWGLLNWLIMGSPLYFLGSLAELQAAFHEQFLLAREAGTSISLKTALINTGPVAWSVLLLALAGWIRGTRQHNRTASVLALLSGLQVGCGILLRLLPLPAEMVAQHLFATALPCALLAWAIPGPAPAPSAGPPSQRIRAILQPSLLAGVLLLIAIGDTLWTRPGHPVTAPTADNTAIIEQVTDYINARSHHPSSLRPAIPGWR
jgi:hypothetical protein